MNVIKHNSDCRICKSTLLTRVLALENSPIGDQYITSDRLDVIQQTYPIELYMCAVCGLAQLLDVIDPSVLYGDYIYETKSSYGLQKHFGSYASDVTDKCNLRAGDFVIDLGSNDGTLLKEFKALGMNVLGVEPARHIANHANENGINTIGKFFSPELADEIAINYGQANLITANNVFANIDELLLWVTGIKKLLDKQGVFIFESFYLGDVVKNLVFDFIYHEHLSAFSLKPVEYLFNQFDMKVFSVERINTKGGSLRYFICHAESKHVIDQSLEVLRSLEESEKIYEMETYINFRNKINQLKNHLIKFISEAVRNDKKIVGFGASITCTTLIYDFSIGQYCKYLVDDNPAKQNKYSPGHHLPVYDPSYLYKDSPDYVLLLAWRFGEIFMNQHQKFIDAGGKFIQIIPTFKIID